MQAIKKQNKEYMEFFGIHKPLFISGPLVGDDIQRFVDRDNLLKFFKASLQAQNICAVAGKQGTGKSSFLYKLMDECCKSMYCSYLDFCFPNGEIEKSRSYFLRAILKNILDLISKQDELLNLFEKDEIDFEMKRLEFSIIIENQTSTQTNLTGGFESDLRPDFLKLLIPVDLKAKVEADRTKEEQQTKTTDFPIHNDNSLLLSIEKIVKKLQEPIVLFIDELDKIGRFPLETPEWDRELIKILELSREIMSNEKLIMMFSLQDELYAKLIKAKRGEGDISILGLINIFERIEPFNIDFAREAVAASLAVAGYKKNISDLLEKGVIEITFNIVKGNPRLFMNYLIELSIEAHLKGDRMITLGLLKKYINKLFPEISENEWNEMVRRTIEA